MFFSEVCVSKSPLTLSSFFYLYLSLLTEAKKVHYYLVCPSLSIFFHLFPSLLFFIFRFLLCLLVFSRSGALWLVSIISPSIIFPFFFLCLYHLALWFQAIIISGSSLISFHFLFLFYEGPFLRLERQRGTQAALKRQWSGCWKQSIFQNAAVQSRTFMLAE